MDLSGRVPANFLSVMKNACFSILRSRILRSLQRTISDGEMGKQIRNVTHVVQNLDTQLGLLAFQTWNKDPALPLYQDFGDGPNNFGIVGRMDNLLPKPSELCCPPGGPVQKPRGRNPVDYGSSTAGIEWGSVDHAAGRSRTVHNFAKNWVLGHFIGIGRDWASRSGHDVRTDLEVAGQWAVTGNKY